MFLLAVDFGTKRIGLAWADTSLGVVLPYGLIEGDGMAKKIQELTKIIASDRITKLIVGFPLGLKGEENKNTERVKKFVYELQKYTNVPVEYFDERFTSQAADAVGQGVSRDERSAMQILDGYMQKEKRKSR